MNIILLLIIIAIGLVVVVWHWISKNDGTKGNLKFIVELIVAGGAVWFGYNQFLVNDRLVALEQADRRVHFIFKTISDCEDKDEKIKLTNVGSWAESVEVAIGGKLLENKINITEGAIEYVPAGGFVILSTTSPDATKTLKTGQELAKFKDSEYYKKLDPLFRKLIDSQQGERWVVVYYVDAAGQKHADEVRVIRHVDNSACILKF